MGNTGTFRSAINGFNRQDVMDYLESASQRYESLKKEKAELERIRTEQQALVSELEALHKESSARNEEDAQEIARLQEQLKAREEECRLLRDSVAELEAEKEAAAAVPAVDPAVAEALRAELAAVKDELAQCRTREAEAARKAEEYDGMKERIATLELNASRRAADIEQTAKTEAGDLLNRTEQQARELLAKAEREAEALVEKARRKETELGLRRAENSRKFRESLQSAAKDTEAGAGQISGELERLSEKLKGIVSSLTGTARRFDLSEEPEAGAEAPGRAAEAEAKAPNDASEHHCRHE